MAYEQYIHPRTGAYCAFMELNSDKLDQELPNALPHSTKPDNTQKTLREWVTRYVVSTDGTKAIILFNIKTHECGRLYPMTLGELITIRDFLQSKGLLGSVLTLAEAKDIFLNSGRYNAN